jgi:FtsP/CotA-like multicopper oxidase with cupredoxin domain
VHGASFQIVTLNGEEPTEADRGWKDTLVVTEEPSEILLRFNHTATDEFPYMYHCHMLEHEDGGMMGQFTVTE